LILVSCKRECALACCSCALRARRNAAPASVAADSLTHSAQHSRDTTVRRCPYLCHNVIVAKSYQKLCRALQDPSRCFPGLTIKCVFVKCAERNCQLRNLQCRITAASRQNSYIFRDLQKLRRSKHAALSKYTKRSLSELD
jgi:hypothetical protein